MSAPRILLLGASGFLGSHVAGQLRHRGDEDLILHVGRRAPRDQGRPGEELVAGDLSDPQVVTLLLERFRPGRIINCAALADVDRCEVEPEFAEALNVRLPAELAAWAHANGATLLHVSTDGVFDGRNGPYTATDRPTPLNIYGRTKRAGEEAVLEAEPDALVARTNIVGWSPSGQRSLLEFFHRRLSRSEVAPGFTDVRFRPLPVQRFLPSCESLLAAGRRGLVHVTGPELLSKHEFGRLVARVFDLDPALVVASSLSESGLAAARARDLDVLPTLLPDGSMPVAGSLEEGLVELKAIIPPPALSSSHRSHP